MNRDVFGDCRKVSSAKLGRLSASGSEFQTVIESGDRKCTTLPHVKQVLNMQRTGTFERVWAYMVYIV